MLRRFAAFVCSLMAAFALFASPVRASDKSEIDAVAQKSITTFLAGDVAGLEALGAPATQTVMDEFGRHYWTGPNALGDWFRDFNADAKKNGISDVTFKLGPAKFAEVDGDRAWVTYSASYSYKMKGAVSRESGLDAFTFEKVGGKWRILGFAWARTS